MVEPFNKIVIYVFKFKAEVCIIWLLFIAIPLRRRPNPNSSNEITRFVAFE